MGKHKEHDCKSLHQVIGGEKSWSKSNIYERRKRNHFLKNNIYHSLLSYSNFYYVLSGSTASAAFKKYGYFACTQLCKREKKFRQLSQHQSLINSKEINVLQTNGIGGLRDCNYVVFNQSKSKTAAPFIRTSGNCDFGEKGDFMILFNYWSGNHTTLC